MKVSKCKANNVILFDLIILSIYQLYNTKDCNIYKGVRIDFKIFEVKIKILFSIRQKLIVDEKR